MVQTTGSKFLLEFVAILWLGGSLGLILWGLVSRNRAWIPGVIGLLLLLVVGFMGPLVAVRTEQRPPPRQVTIRSPDPAAMAPQAEAVDVLRGGDGPGLAIPEDWKGIFQALGRENALPPPPWVDGGAAPDREGGIVAPLAPSPPRSWR